MKIYFSDFFEIDPNEIEKHGAFNISLINDLPLFIDPFLLFSNEKHEYRILHDDIIQYLSFLRDISSQPGIKKGLLKNWFSFHEVKQSWLGYSKIGNQGSGLGNKFAESLNKNLNYIFSNFGSEEISIGSHLEKLCLINDGVGRDNISDFTSNLIKGYLLKYTQEFSIKHINKKYLREFAVDHVRFDYVARRWIPSNFILPTIGDDYVLLTPKEILTKDDTWINKTDMIGNFTDIVSGIPNDQLRAQMNDYFLRMLPINSKKTEYNKAISKTILKYPEYIDYFIKYKEDSKDEAKIFSAEKVKAIEVLFVKNCKSFVESLSKNTLFYNSTSNSFEESYQRVIFLKQVIENNDGYRFFYKDGKPIKREMDLQLIFRLTWYATEFDVNSEVNNGRGPVDYKISKGSADKTLVEFKLASNKKIKQNLENQVAVYAKANQTPSNIKVILYFTDSERKNVFKILKELGIFEGKSMIIIDARPGKISASNVRSKLEN